MKFDAAALADSTEPRRLWRAGPHGTALPALRHAIARGRQLAVLTGETGVGKTIGLNTLSQQLADDGLTLVRISPPVVDAGDLRAAVGLALGGSAVTTTDDVVAAARDAGRIAIVIDDTQAVSDAALGEVGVLLLAIPGSVAVLAGPDTLAARLATPAIGVLSTIVPVTRRLRPLAETETELFIEHLLEAAGVSYEAISPEVMRAIWRASGGSPRVILHLCRRTLESATPPDRAQLRRWTEAIDEQPVQDEESAELPGVVMLTAPPAARSRGPWRMVAIGIALVMAIAVVVVAEWPSLRPLGTPPPATTATAPPSAPVPAATTATAPPSAQKPTAAPSTPGPPASTAPTIESRPPDSAPAPSAVRDQPVSPAVEREPPVAPPIRRAEPAAPTITSTSATARPKPPATERRATAPPKSSPAAPRDERPAPAAAVTEDRRADTPDPGAVIDWLLKER